ncbi:flavonol sulfotransferase-like [Pistacia vera]|uniref:flavonol sulfotransferase-like n=1 Tax=Pistacia vera TaxID=55513 RepID=UPI00126338BE|nr:flavonol sulfotransferase-like [Pistacia vera]
MDSIKEAQDSPKTYEDIISTLPKDNGWKKPLYLYQGFWYIAFQLEGVIFAQQNFQTQPGDIFLCSFPKSGTTWLKALAFAIVTRNRFDPSSNPLLTKQPHDCVPFLEMDYFENPAISGPGGLSLWATHIPYASLPKSITDSSCKIVYICRDPKDVFVSLWHYLNKLRADKFEGTPIERAFELYCNGSSLYGPQWDHVLGYWKASLERPNQVLFIQYEDMKKDSIFHLKKLAEFIGYPLSLEEESEGRVQKIIELCSFENLSNLEVNKTGKRTHREVEGGKMDNNAYFRKGEIGDWKNLLTSEMGEKLDNITEKKFSGSGLTFS